MKSIKPTILCLRISSIIYFLIAVLSILVGFYFMEDDLLLKLTFITLFLISIFLCVFIEIVINGLKKRKKWTWFASLILCGIYIPSAFIILGIVGIIPLFDSNIRKEFNL